MGTSRALLTQKGGSSPGTSKRSVRGAGSQGVLAAEGRIAPWEPAPRADLTRSWSSVQAPGPRASTLTPSLPKTALSAWKCALLGSERAPAPLGGSSPNRGTAGAEADGGVSARLVGSGRLLEGSCAPAEGLLVELDHGAVVSQRLSNGRKEGLPGKQLSRSL